MSYKAVLFDMDGTLLDTLEDLRDSTNHVLRQMGYPERSLEEMRRFVGNGAEKQIRRAVPEGTSEEKIMEVLTAYRAYYQDHCQIKTRVYDGLLDMLSELKAKGINRRPQFKIPLQASLAKSALEAPHTGHSQLSGSFCPAAEKNLMPLSS